MVQDSLGGLCPSFIPILYYWRRSCGGGGGRCYLVPGFQGRTGICQIASKIIISGKLIFFYWQLLIILFAIDIAKKKWNYTSLCFEKGKKYFWRGRFWHGRGAVMAFIPDRLSPYFCKSRYLVFSQKKCRQKCAFGKCFIFV